MTITTRDKLRCAERELGYRHRVYARLVQRRKMSQLDAWREIELMAAIVEDYRVAVAIEEPGVRDVHRERKDGDAMMTEQQLITKLKAMMDGRSAELQERAVKMLLAGHRQQQHLLKTKGKSLDQVMVLIEENIALAHLLGGDEAAHAYIDNVCEGWDEIIDKEHGTAEELWTRLNELHALMIEQGR
jgi:hypothetical protein